MDQATNHRIASFIQGIASGASIVIWLLIPGVLAVEAVVE